MGDSEILLAQKSFLKGPVTNNGFVNFMRDYTAGSRGLDVPDVIKGGKLWNRLPLSERKKYRFAEEDYDEDDDDAKDGECETDDGDMEDDMDDDMDENADEDAGDADEMDDEEVVKDVDEKDKDDMDDMDDACRRPNPCCPKPKPSCKPRRRRPKPCSPKPKPCCPKPKPSCKRRRRPKRSCPKPKPSCSKPKRSCPKPKRCCPKPKPRCPKPCPKKMKCQKPGPVTNNGYLNFLRAYRRKHCGLKPKDLVMKAARAWCRLSECQKDYYRRQACKVTTSCRHKRRRVCAK